MKKAFWIAAAALLVAVPLFSRELPRELDLFMDVMNYVKSDYVEEVPSKKLVQGALSGMLKSLDPYSQFLNEDAYRDIKIDTEGEFSGIGVEISTKGGVLHVIAAIEGAPAAAAGVESGDVILKIDNEPARDLTLDQAVLRMRGKPGSRIRLTLMREKDSRLLELEIVRASVKVRSVKDVKLLEGGVGYMHLTSFQERTDPEFKRALRALQLKNMRGLILDLRNNAGGLLTSAVELAEEFIPEGEIIVSTKGRTPERSNVYLSKNPHPYNVGRFAVLVNRGSASGSEIFAGAMQDHGLARIIGAKTFGKGSIQTLMPLSDGTAIRLTTSRYYTPSGRIIHEVGITPDETVAEPELGADKPLEKALAWVKNSK